ncbi:MFS transporter [Pseudonocardia adelaidensis]|uniref:MFS transporter n=1 Tax=Pseudonocardia adelaidensis TaxID=648754 RepID=A0ABP9NSB7_9PSEU
MKHEDGEGRRVVAFATGVGNFTEWFDFAIYGFLAATLGRLFFPGASPAASLLASLAVFGVAFFMRPLGGFVLGAVGDRLGRRALLTLSIGLMGLSTTLIGVLPTYGTAGLLAPVLLVLLRCLQGFSAGAEWTGSAAFLIEHTPVDRRGRFASVVSATAALATCVGGLLVLALEVSLGPDQMAAWGWRIPFLVAVPLTAVGTWVRLRIDETPVFRRLVEAGERAEAPLRQSGRDVRAIALTFAFSSVQGLGFYYLATYVITYLTATVELSRPRALVLVATGLVCYALLCPLAGAVSDRLGRRRVNLVGGLGLAVVAVPAFALMGTGTAAGVIGGMVLFAVFQSMVSVTTVCMLVELFPAQTRSTSSSIGFNLGLALIGGPGPLVAAAIASATGSSTLPALYMVVVAAVATLALVRWLPEVGGTRLDAVGPRASLVGQDTTEG